MVDWKAMQKTYGGILAAIFIVLILVLSIAPTGYAVAKKTTSSGIWTWWPLSIFKPAISALPKVNTTVSKIAPIKPLPLDKTKIGFFKNGARIEFEGFSSLVLNPYNPSIGEETTITAVAAHPPGVAGFRFELDGKIVKECAFDKSNPPTLASCSYTTSFPSKRYHDILAYYFFSEGIYGRSGNKIYVTGSTRDTDKIPPTVDFTYSPSKALKGESILFGVTGADNSKVIGITIRQGTVIEKECQPFTKGPASCYWTIPPSNNDFTGADGWVSDDAGSEMYWTYFHYTIGLSSPSGGGGGGGGGGGCVKPPCTVIQ